MKILALDTSGIVATVAIVEDTKTIAEFTINHKKTHSQTIMPMLDTIIKSVDFELNTIDYIAVASGPGSFTGLRIGAGTAKGLAHALGKKIIPIPTLDGLAYNIFQTNKIICPIMDARCNQVYSAFYIWNNKNKIQRYTDYLAESIDAIIDKALFIMFEEGEDIIFLGDGVSIYMDKLKNALGENNCMFAPPNCNMQRATSIASLALELENLAINHSEFAPFYIRKSQAERALLKED